MISNFLRNTVSVLISTILLLTAVSTTKAEDLNNEPLKPDELVSLNLEFKSNSELKEKLKGNYKIQVTFDDSKLKYKKFNYKGSFKKKDLQIEKSENLLELNYCPEGKPIKRKTRKVKSESLEFIFAVKNTAPKCETLIESKFVNLDTNEEKPINSKIVSLVGNPDLDKCKIKNLAPNTGNLIPDFNPEILDYEMTVEHNTKYIDFDVDPMMEDLKIKINRSKLKSAGEYTDISITVSNKKLKLKNTYNIKVYRKDKPKDDYKKSNNKVAVKNENKSNANKSEENKNSKHQNQSKKSSKSHNTNSKKISKPPLHSEDIKNENEKEIKLDTCNSEPLNENIIIKDNNENSNFRIYITFTFLVVSAGIAIYLSIKTIISKKKSEESNENQKS